MTDVPPPELPDSPPPAPSSPARPAPPWMWPVMCLAIVFLVVGGTVFGFWSCHRIPRELVREGGQMLEKAGRALHEVASAFARGNVTSSFVSYASTIGPTHYLQFATLNQMEIFTRSDERSLGYLPLPEVVVEARAPIEYTYFVDLNGAWNFVMEEGVIYVFCPPIRYNKPAVDASTISYEVRKGMFGSAKVLEDLKQSLTLLASRKAHENINLIREVGRKQVTDFVEHWLMQSFTDGRRYPVKVYFPDEPWPGLMSLTNAPPG